MQTELILGCGGLEMGGRGRGKGEGVLTVTLYSTVSTSCGSPIETALQSLVVRSMWCQNAPWAFLPFVGYIVSVVVPPALYALMKAGRIYQ